MGGYKGSRGGKKQRRKFYAEFDGFDEYLEKINELNGDLKEIVSDALEQAADDPTADTIKGMEDKWLPAEGEYSTGNTAKTVIRKPKVTWGGSVAMIGIGFDKTKNGVGTLLITGTPRMQPDPILEDVYTKAKTNKEFFNTVSEALQNAIEDLEG